MPDTATPTTPQTDEAPATEIRRPRHTASSQRAIAHLFTYLGSIAGGRSPIEASHPIYETLRNNQERTSVKKLFDVLLWDYRKRCEKDEARAEARAREQASQSTPTATPTT